MALRGNLKDFSLPDVFQLVTFSRKTGVLRIARSDGAEGGVWFRDGDVFFASSNWHNEPLGERLVKAQRITPQALKRALEIRSGEPADGRRLGQILIDEGYITDRVLEAFVAEQIQDTIFDLMRWDEGDFDFEAMPDVVDEDIGLSVSIENVVMEGSRRLEEWNRIRKKIPSMDVVFKMATAPGEGTFEISLKPMEWQLLLLVDGSRSVAELATATNRTDFEVARIIYGLFSAGLLEFATEEEIQKNRAERIEREARLAEIEAERKKVQEAARKEALEREAALEAEAARRREAEADATRAAEDAAVIEAAKAARTEPEEEPQFLGGSVSSPSAEDESVLEAFMGAVLDRPAPMPEPAAPEPVAPAVPYVPVEEPAFMGVEHGEDTDLPVVPVPSVEELLPGIAPSPPVATAPEVAEVLDTGLADLPEPDAEFALDHGTDTAPPVDEISVEIPDEPEPESAPAVEGEIGFEKDLMALGLGELPSDLLSPVGSVEEQLPAEPMSEIHAVSSPAEIGDLSELLGEGVGASETEIVEPAALEIVEPGESTIIADGGAVEDEPDFSALLESLDVDAEGSAEDASALQAGFDEDLLRDVVEPDVGGGVISTDAFLEDIAIDEDLGFSGGLNDELSALTGAERRGPSRPQASVNTLPAEGSGTLHRDTRVDKDTVLKIIDGIKNL